VLLTGVVAWWPKSKKMLKNRLTVSTDKGFRRFVYDTHVSLGIYAFVFLFIIALTGPVFSFKWYKQGMSRLFGQETEQKEMKMEMKKDDAKQTATKEDAFAGGNAEQMIDYETGEPWTAHTTNPVPFILVNAGDYDLAEDGKKFVFN